jgi:hypothetical protein
MIVRNLLALWRTRGWRGLAERSLLIVGAWRRTRSSVVKSVSVNI